MHFRAGFMLPQTLIFLLNTAIASAQSRTSIPLNSVVRFNAQNSTSFTIPPSQGLNVSIAICSESSSVPRFFVTNSSSTADNPGSDGGTDVYEITLDSGLGTFAGPFPIGGVLALEDGSNFPFEVGVSDNGVFHELLASTPLFGDSTADHVILFSRPFQSVVIDEPTYPNYTMTAANATLNSAPTSQPNFTLIISPASNSLALKPQTGCILSAQTSTGTVVNQTSWPKDESGWRSQWIVDGLASSTNYTVYVVEDSTKVSGPIYFLTKSSSFACNLVSSLPYCPSVAYSIPLDAPSGLSAGYNASNLPSSISDPIISGLTNFTVILSTFACGRDYYSPLMSCADCQREYRKWLCAISFPRCADDSLSSSSSNSPNQIPLSPALMTVNNNTDARNTNFPDFSGTPYSSVLPCLERCQAVDRACPYFLGFKCPVPQFSASQSYGVGYIDGVKGASITQGMGLTGTAVDRWGNVWCNPG